MKRLGEINNKYAHIAFILFICAFFWGESIYGQNSAKTEIGIVEHLDEFIPGGIMLYNEEGDSVNLLNVIDKPTVISLVYFRCPGICSPLMEGIADVMNRSDLKIGEDYQVLTISFNPQENIDLGIRKKRNYLKLIDSTKREIISEHWKFFVSDSANINAVTEALGFKYKKSGNDYMHSATLIFTSPQGKITRYLNGVKFLPFELKMAVIESSKGISGPTINKILQYCFAYDVEGNKYVLNITRVAGTIILITLLIFFIYLVIKNKKKK